MALAGGIAQLMEQSVGGEFAIEDHQRGIGELGPEVGGKLELAVVVGPERQGRQHMTAQHHERHHTHHRIAARALPASRDAAEGGLVLRRVGCAQRHTVDTVDRQPAPALGVGCRRAPNRRGLREQRSERFGTEAITGLDDGAAADRHPAWAGGQDQVQMAHDLADRAIAQQRHADDEPHNVFGRELAPPDRCRAGGRQRVGDPLGIECLAEDLEACRALARADGK